MTKPPQQTIGNTVYTVGQVITVDEMLDTPYGTQFEIEPPTAIYAPQYLKLKITALPNPDPVEDEWRVVEMQKMKMVIIDPDRGIAQDHPRDFGEQLQLAMKEVVKADERELTYPKEYFVRPIYCNVTPLALRDIQDIALCFLLGGTVKVRGGL